MTAGRPPIPLDRKIIQAKGDGRVGNQHRIGKEIVPVAGVKEGVVSQNRKNLPRVATQQSANLGKHGKAVWNNIWDSVPWLRPDEHWLLVLQIAEQYEIKASFRMELDKHVEITGSYTTPGYKDGMIVEHPLIASMRACDEIIFSRMKALGLTPSERNRLAFDAIKQETGLQDLQKRTQEQ